MFAKVAYKITHHLCEKHIIQREDFDLYMYGFDMGLTVVLNLISTILVGVIMGMVFESIAFLAFYIPLRSYAGGYHANTPLRCYIISVFIIFAILTFCKYLPYSFLLYGSLFGIGIVACTFLCPVQDNNKPLDNVERKRYKKNSIIILMIEIFTWMILVFVLNLHEHIIPMAVFTEAVMLVLGKVKIRG